MTPEIAKIVGLKTQPKELLDFTQRLKDLVALSRSQMKTYYDKWESYDMVYRGEREADDQDRKSQARKEPVKLTLPLTFSQVQTFVAFGHSLYNQRDYYFETIASGEEDEGPAKIATALLEQNLIHNKYRSVGLIQKLTDIGRFGVGITKESWVREQVPVVQQVPDESKMQNVRAEGARPVNVPTKTQVTYATKYLGNKITNISPFRWFPDTRLPLTRWSEGEFCADEIEESKDKIEEFARNGLVAGFEYVSELPVDSTKDRRLTFIKQTTQEAGRHSQVAPHYCLLTEVQIRLNPSQTMIDENTPLSDCDCTQVYVVWIANDDRIIRISEAGYNHEEFGYNCAQLFDDQNRFINFSLAEILSQLQDTATWFLNSRVTSVRKNIFNQTVVDPAAVEMDDIIKRRPVIRLKAGRAGSGVNTWIEQLKTADVTQGHLTDIAALNSLAKEATGINETLLGQFSPGRRSAREAANVANYAASRLTMLFASIWDASEVPMARKMLSNLRQGLDEPTLVRVYGQVNTQRMPDAAVAFAPNIVPQFRMQSVTKENLVGSFDFSVFNGTLPSQRQATAATLLEWLQTALKDPRVVMVTGLDPQLVMLEVFELLGVRNVQRFRLTPERLQQLMFMAQPPGNAGGAGAPPNGGGPA